MQKSNILLIILLFISACVEQEPELIISRWKTKVSPSLDRQLASIAGQGNCLEANFSTATLRAQILELEKDYPAVELDFGNWRHLDLKKIPVPAANFFFRFGDMIGDLKDPQAINFDGCMDVPCVFNRIYSKRDDHINGHVHYLWFLKFASLLSADNQVPVPHGPDLIGSYNGKEFSLKDYLYTEQELYGFWRLSLMLGIPHSYLPKVVEIQKIPRGEPIDPLKPDVCARASTSGYIRLDDRCLNMDKGDESAFYKHVIHELSHAVDFELGRKLKVEMRSGMPDYRKLIGLNVVKEWVDAQGVFHYEWVEDKSVARSTAYAYESPAESFAEDLTFYRLNPSTLNSLSEDHLKFLKQKIFSFHSYDWDTQVDELLLNLKHSVGADAFELTNSCAQGSKGSSESLFTSADFHSQTILPEMVTCLGSKALALKSDLESNIRKSTPEGCQLLADENKVKWDIRSRQLLVEVFEKALSDVDVSPVYQERKDELKILLADPLDARKALIKCFGELDEEACFNQSIESFSTIAEYSEHHPYKKTKADVEEFYQALVNTNLPFLRSRARELWDTCKVDPNDEKDHFGSVFTVTEGYLVSSIYNCINTHVTVTVEKAIPELVYDGHKAIHPREPVMVRDFVRNVVVGELNHLLEEQRALEASQVADLIHSGKNPCGQDAAFLYHLKKELCR